MRHSLARFDRFVGMIQFPAIRASNVAGRAAGAMTGRQLFPL
jgi:hypothetical protein